MSDKIKFKFPENPNGGNNVFTPLEEKIDLSEEDELLLNHQGRIRKIKAKAFKGERGEKGEVGEKGERGLTGLQGEKGEKGDPFRYSDFTEEQIENLKVKGDKGDPGEKGDPGKNFEYSDFTEEQLEGLRGPQGLPGKDGTGAGDMLGVNNLSDLNDIVVARENLDVFSKTEVENKISENTFSKNYNDLINKPDFENNPYQKIEDVRGIVRLPRDEKFKNNNTHFGFIDGGTIGLPGSWYDIITFNGRVADNYIHHPIKQLALGPDGIYFRKQNGDNSWSEWQKITTNDKITEELKIDTLREKSNFDSGYDFFVLQSFGDKKNFKLTWENLIKNIKQNTSPQLIYDSGELTLSTGVSMIDHNLNINKEDFVIGRYKMLLIQGTSYNTSFTFEDNLSSSGSNPATNSNRARIYLYNYNSPRVLKIYKFW